MGGIVKNTRKDIEFKRRCEDIKKAAEIVFANDGYNNATMEDIAIQCEYAA